MKATVKRILGIILAILMISTSLIGCGDQPAQTSQTPQPSDTSASSIPTATAPETNADRERVTIRFSQPDTGIDNTAEWKNDTILAEIEKAVNVDIEWDSGSEGYPERLQTELISGTAPDLFCNYGEQEKTTKWITDQVVTDLGKILEANPDRYPILNKMISSPSYKMYNDFYSGDANKSYSLYALYPFKAWAGASVYNAALLQKSGFSKAPETVDEFVQFASKLGEQGISGWWPRNNKLTNLNEIDKTIFAPNGTTVMSPIGSPWTGFMPVGGKSAVEGEWKLMTASVETKASLKTLAQLYKSGGLDVGVGIKDDFAQAIDEFVAGKIGAINFGFSNYGQYSWALDEKWLKGNPNGSYKDLVLGKTLVGTAGPGVTYNAPFWMGFNWFIPESCKNPERVLDLVEFLATDAGQDLLFKGVEGTHYTKDAAGNVTYNKDEWLKTGKIYNIEDGRCQYSWFVFLFAASQQQLKLQSSTDWFETSMNPIVVDTIPDSEAKTYANQVVDSYKGSAYGDLPPYFTIIQFTPEINDIRTKLNEITLRYVPSFITGQLDIEKEWANYATEYEAAGAKQLEAAFNEAVKAAKAKFDSFK